MSFAIEVPGEANPLSLTALCRILQAATGNDHAQRQSAGQQLAAWEQTPGYYSSLQVSPPPPSRGTALPAIREKRWKEDMRKRKKTKNNEFRINESRMKLTLSFS